jgi:hypothetical protein
MSAEVGLAVCDILDRAAREHIKQSAPDSYDHFVWQVHGAGTVRHYDGSDVYWRRVQAALDSFFTTEQRVEICRSLMRRAELAALPECRRFRALALAEARVADLVAGVGQIAAATRQQVSTRRAWNPLDRGLC